MSEQDAQKTWDEYHERIKNRRLAQAKVINLELEKNSITSETDLILDFSFFTQDEAGADGIKNQLSENYEMTISKKGEYWHINGTSMRVFRRRRSPTLFCEKDGGAAQTGLRARPQYGSIVQPGR